MAQHHIWSYPDSHGVKYCLYEGCTVRVRGAYSEWQSKRRGPWCSVLIAEIPACSGTPPTEGR